MSKIILVSTLAVCGVAAIASAWLGTASGLFALDGYDFGVCTLSIPYFALALLAWGYRRTTITLDVLLVLSILVGGFGLWFLYNADFRGRGNNQLFRGRKPRFLGELATFALESLIVYPARIDSIGIKSTFAVSCISQRVSGV
jgi:hypothetical protein